MGRTDNSMFFRGKKDWELNAEGALPVWMDMFACTHALSFSGGFTPLLFDPTSQIFPENFSVTFWDFNKTKKHNGLHNFIIYSKSYTPVQAIIKVIRTIISALWTRKNIISRDEEAISYNFCGKRDEVVMEGKFVWEPRCPREISIAYGVRNTCKLVKTLWLVV